jgi:hypothetical protein
MKPAAATLMHPCLYFALQTWGHQEGAHEPKNGEAEACLQNKKEGTTLE